MGLAYECDVCGSLYKQYDIHKGSQEILTGTALLVQAVSDNVNNPKNMYIDKIRTICPACIKDINDYIERRHGTRAKS